MYWAPIQKILLLAQHFISIVGVLIILSGVLLAFFQYIYFSLSSYFRKKESNISKIRLTLGRILVLGLEFIVAADLIGTTTAPDYYSVGILAIIVIIRTVLNYSLNHEINSLIQEIKTEGETTT